MTFSELLNKYVWVKQRDHWGHVLNSIAFCFSMSTKLEIIQEHFCEKIDKSEILKDFWHLYNMTTCSFIFNIWDTLKNKIKLSCFNFDEFKLKYKDIFDCSLYIRHTNIDTHEKTKAFKFSYCELYECLIDLLTLFCSEKHEKKIIINDIFTHFKNENRNFIEELKKLVN